MKITTVRERKAAAAQLKAVKQLYDEANVARMKSIEQHDTTLRIFADKLNELEDAIEDYDAAKPKPSPRRGEGRKKGNAGGDKGATATQGEPTPG